MADDIASLILAGLSDFDIAKRAGVSESSVRRQRRHMRKQPSLYGGRAATAYQPPQRSNTKMLDVTETK